MKNFKAALVIFCAAVLCGCAAKSAGQTAAPNSPEEVASGCFARIAKADAAGFYEHCLAKLASGGAAEVHRSRWMRTISQAGEKIGLSGGLLSQQVACQTLGNRALCEIAYELANGEKSRVKMPLQMIESQWRVIR